MKLSLTIDDEKTVKHRIIPFNHRGLLEPENCRKIISLPEDQKHEALVSLSKQLGRCFDIETIFQMCRAISEIK